MRSRLTVIFALLLALASAGPVFAGEQPGQLHAAGGEKQGQASTGADARVAAAAAARKDRPRVLETGVIKDVTPAEPAGAMLYNVVFKDSVKDPKAAAMDLAKAQGFKPTHVYRNLFKGFAGKMTAEQARKLAKDPKVVSVDIARKMQLLAQETPLGISRIQATVNPVAKIDGLDERVDADVMVIDELVDMHPDLNVVSRVDCVDGTVNGNELGIGHGTHVAGTIAALDNGIGVVGVAPGARIWSANVFQNGGAYDSWIACALDAAAAAKVDVANMSLGGSAVTESTCGGRDVMHNAVCRAVSAGVTVVVAAGNSAKDSKYFVPAQYDEVITVSALDDTDGKSGGLGVSNTYGRDDSLASFSNFGADVDIAAPGVSVKSTMPGNTLGSMSGTSMASPHVAGSAALYRAQNPSATPAQVKAAIQANRENVALSADRDGINEGVLNVANLNGGSTPPPPPPPSDTTAPTVALTSPTSSSVKQSFTMTATASDASGINRVEFWYCNSTGCYKIGSDTTSPYSLSVKGGTGNYELYAVAYDNAGNRAESAHKFITVTRSAVARSTETKNAKHGKDSKSAQGGKHGRK